MFRKRFWAALGAAVVFSWPQVTTAQAGAPAIPREFRGAWVASVANIDWPSRPGLSAWQQQAELIAILDRARALHGLKRFVEARKTADEALALRPQGRTSAYLRVVSGDLYVEENNLSQAAADYLYVINFHEDADLKPLAIHKYIGVLEKQGKADEAAKFKAKLTTEFPNWRAP